MTTYRLPIWDELAAELNAEPGRPTPQRRRPAPYASAADAEQPDGTHDLYRCPDCLAIAPDRCDVYYRID